MRKTVVLLAAIALLFTACRTQSTVQTTSTAQPPDSAPVTTGDGDSTTEGGSESGSSGGLSDAGSTDGDTDSGGESAAEDADADSASPSQTGDDTEDADTSDGGAGSSSGSDDDSSDNSDADSGAADGDDSSDSASSSSAAAEPTPTVVPFATTAPLPGQADAVQAVLDADDWCQAAEAVGSGTGVLDTTDFSDPVALEQAFTQAVAVITAAERLAPAELADDVNVSVRGFTALAVALEDAGWRFVDLDLGLVQEFDTETQLASYNIQKYNFEVCGVGEDPGAPPTAEDLTQPPDGGDIDIDSTIREQTVLGLTQAGFTEEQANCLLDNLNFNDPAALSDTNAVFQVFTTCGISLDQLGQIGG